MSKVLTDLETQKANALALAKYFDDQISAMKKPKRKPDKKIIAAERKAEKNINKRYGITNT